MQLLLRNFTTLVEQAAAAVQGSASQVLDFTVGSVLRAILEANASLALWLQWLILLVLQTTRLATSIGTDADSFGADFGMTRLPAVAAQGSVTFSRYTPSMTAFIPANTIVTTADSATQFAVRTDTTNAAWSASQNGYLLGTGVSSVTVPVAALVAGSAGDVLPDTISLVASALPGIDTVTNALALAGGLDAETDAAFRLRFQSFIDSRTRATVQAVSYAATSVEQGVTCTVQENNDGTGGFAPGRFVVTVDDGSGSPPASLLASIQAAVDAVRPIGSIFAVNGPTRLPADVALTLVLTQGADSATAIEAVSSAITAFINALPVGAGLPYTRLAQLAYDASPAIVNVSGLLLQGATATSRARPPPSSKWARSPSAEDSSMIGDETDMQTRLLAALPNGWFADEAPLLASLLGGLASVWAWLYSLLTYARQQTRIATATDGWLDLIARDYGGPSWARQNGETDVAFRSRITRNLQRLRATRAALTAGLLALTGRVPSVFEPAYPPDTGGLASIGLGWNTVGGWGSLMLPYQCFVIAYRPAGGGIANTGGWGGGAGNLALGGWNTGALQYGDTSLIKGEVTDAQILSTIADSMPAAAIAWTALSN